MKFFVFFLMFFNINFIYADILTCPSKIKIDKESNQYTDYILGIQSGGVGHSLIKWHKDGLVCGYTSRGVLNLEASTVENGVLNIKIISYDLTVRYQGILKKTISKKYINWKGKVKDKNNKNGFMFLKRKKNINKSNLNKNNLFTKYRKEMKLTENDILDKYHGAYYCGDGGCNGLDIRVFVYKNKIDKTMEEINRLKSFISSVELDSGEDCFTALKFIEDYSNAPKNINKKNATCLLAKAYPLKEPEAVIELNKIDTLLYARRLGGEAGADIDFISMNDVAINGEAYLTNRIQLDVVKFSKTLDIALNEYFSNGDLYISKPSYQNNTITWNIKGRKSDFNHESINSNEWWKVRIQAFIFQKNAGDYILGVGLPETRITKWSLTDNPPSDSKFQKELTNDPIFLNLRGQLIIVFASGLEFL